MSGSPAAISTRPIARYESGFGLTVVSREVNLEQGVREAMLRVGRRRAGGPSWVQLLEPLGPDTPVGKFLARRGEGMHHVGLRGGRYHGRARLDRRRRRFRPIDQRPRHGSMGASIAFLHPADLGGVLTELVEPAAG